MENADLSQFTNLLRKSTDLRIGDVTRILDGHVVDERVDLAWQISTSAAANLQGDP